MARELELLYGDTLAELGVTGPDRVVSAEDGEVLAEIYSSLWYLLEEMNLVNWEYGGPVPNAAAVPLSWILAWHAAGQFGVVGERLNRLRENGEINGPVPSRGERLLRKLATPPYLSEVTMTEDF